jgi:CRISPR-associated protein Csb2
MLALEIELLTGVYRASLPDKSGAEWPPHPERAFSALVQAWGDGGCDRRERAALEWLESLPAPLIEADDRVACSERSAPTVFVPPNDSPREKEITSLLPDRRRRQSRNFRVAIPENPIIKMIWHDAASENEHRAALSALAHRVASLGHSASLVRLTLTESNTDAFRLWTPDDDGASSLRVARRGRLLRLEEWLSRDERPQPGASIRYRRPAPAPSLGVVKSAFGGRDDWFVFEDAGGSRPDILGFAHVAKCVRASLMTHGPQPTPEVISGHTIDGAPCASPHIAIVPLANIGWDHATGDLLGFGVVLPRDIAPTDRRSVLQALASFAHLGDADEAYADLRFSSTIVWRVERTATPSRASLKTARWCAKARSWASATPVLLDRFPDHNDPIEQAQLIAKACCNVGLPEPTQIEIHKYAAIKGAPSAYPARGNRSLPDWSFPGSVKFASRPRRHVILQFAEPVEGPVIIGAGRFHGFGLCLPLEEEGEF